jgi:hypothetical protein
LPACTASPVRFPVFGVVRHHAEVCSRHGVGMRPAQRACRPVRPASPTPCPVNPVRRTGFWGQEIPVR